MSRLIAACRPLLRTTAAASLVAGALFAQPATAEVTLPPIFGDNMVLQQGMPVRVWGQANPGEMVSVSFGETKAVAKAGEKGEWAVALPAPKTNAEPAKLVVKGSNEIVFDNVLVGEVWLCSGQSNMSMGIKAAQDADQEIAAADQPGIRLFVAKGGSGPKAQWKVCSPRSILEDGEIQAWYPNGAWRGFSAVGYLFGKELHRELNVPVGLIEAAAGGSRIDSWFVLPTPGGAVGPGELGKGVLLPIAPFQIRGAVWYQGEGNTEEGALYVRKLMALVAGWREAWGEPDMPFYLVQTAPWAGYGFTKNPAEMTHTAPVFWEAQLTAAKLIPHAGIVGTSDIDVGDLQDIHPKKKQEVGRRLALQALKKTYGRQDIVADGPVFKSLTLEGSKLRVAFDNVPTALKSKDGKELEWFELLDADRGGFVKAKAEIEGKTVVLSAPGVAKPVAVRFGWSKAAQTNLVNAEGLPAYPFRAADQRVWRMFRALDGGEAVPAAK